MITALKLLCEHRIETLRHSSDAAPGVNGSFQDLFWHSDRYSAGIQADSKIREFAEWLEIISRQRTSSPMIRSQRAAKGRTMNPQAP
jgi:hypothetical protein